ncbi:PAS domain-containing protein [Sulfitobacter guttiformis]|uniref:PAS domain-containing protein n=1 Tax=Sulfitobacter guttiformis TaxID=74349 RepID=A0A420DHS8_9RHOB|nr:PAS domain-containing protein [Sulfitobacter guttiformis]KIN72476.1 PAS domain family protein [Sulfitobacter guttiformis KCTC 32187]RKE93774.1 PAS domain-containing protein [Sulfitobacter guttiformis]
MAHYQPHSGYAPLSIIEAYWHALRGPREVPKRSEIDPRGIESALEFAFILERVAPGVARLRIAGSHLHDLMGMEARGMPLTSFFTQDARLRVAELLEEVFQTPASAEVLMSATAQGTQLPLEARMILLPLKSDLGDVSRILGCIVSQGEIGNAPRRFDLRNIDVRRLDVPKPSEGRAEKQPAGFAEPKHRFTPQPKVAKAQHNELSATKRPPYLRLVKTDE